MDPRSLRSHRCTRVSVDVSGVPHLKLKHLQIRALGIEVYSEMRIHNYSAVYKLRLAEAVAQIKIKVYENEDTSK